MEGSWWYVYKKEGTGYITLVWQWEKEIQYVYTQPYNINVYVPVLRYIHCSSQSPAYHRWFAEVRLQIQYYQQQLPQKLSASTHHNPVAPLHQVEVSTLTYNIQAVSTQDIHYHTIQSIFSTLYPVRYAIQEANRDSYDKILTLTMPSAAVASTTHPGCTAVRLVDAHSNCCIQTSYQLYSSRNSSSATNKLLTYSTMFIFRSRPRHLSSSLSPEWAQCSYLCLVVCSIGASIDSQATWQGDHLAVHLAPKVRHIIPYAYLASPTKISQLATAHLSMI